MQSSDAVTARLKAHVDQWRDITWQSDGQAARLIRDDRIDILVDLAGHTTNARTELLARKPAPIQVSWMGYPGTTGMSAIDYRITDAIADPPGESDRLHVEKLLRLPGCFLCFAPPAEEIVPLDQPSRGCDTITFGCFNRMAKVSDVTIDLWARLLHRLPSARLVLKGGGFDASTIPQWLDRFERHAIERSRITPLTQTPSRREHLSAMRQVGIALDTFPYNATTVTCEWLWMGVPMITLAGQTPASRVGASLLNAAGLGALVARTPDEYVDHAAQLAEDQARLSELRSGLRQRLLESRLIDAAGFTRDLERAYRWMWQESVRASTQ